MKQRRIRPAGSERSTARRPVRDRGMFALHGAPGISARETRLATLAAWALALALGLGLLLMDLGPHRVGDYFTETDFYGAYADGARLVQHGHLIPSRYGVVGPVYEIVLAAVGRVSRDLFAAANAISLVATMASLLLWFYLLRRRANARLALFAALFLAANPYFFRYGYSASTDALAMAFQAAALFVLLAASSGAPAVLVGAGALAGLAFLTRYNAVYLLPAGLAALWWGGTLQPRPRKVAAALYAAGFAVPAVPWVLYSLTHGGTFTFQLHHNIAYEVFARARGLTWDDYQQKLESQFRTPWDVIARDPLAVAGRLLFNLWNHLWLDMRSLLGWPVAVCVALGVALGAADGTLRRMWPVWLAAGLLYLTLLPVAHSERYSLALLPMYAALAAAAFASPLLALAAGPAGRRWPLKAALALIPLTLSGAASVQAQRHTVQLLPREALQCARTLSRLKRPGDRVVARKAQVGFHAGVEVVSFPYTRTYAELARYARGAHARWLYFSWPEAETRPEYVSLLDTTGAVPGLTPRFSSTQGGPAVLYEIGPGFGAEPAWARDRAQLFEHEARGRLMLHHDDAEALLMLGRIANLRGALPEARDLLQRAAIAAPRSVETWMLLGDVCSRMGDVQAGMQAYEQASALDPANPEVRLREGWASLASGQARQAAVLWRPLVSTTRDPVVLERMATLFKSVGDEEGAMMAQASLSRLGAETHRSGSPSGTASR